MDKNEQETEVENNFVIAKNILIHLKCFPQSFIKNVTYGAGKENVYSNQITVGAANIISYLHELKLIFYSKNF